MTHPLANRRTARTCPDELRPLESLAVDVILRALRDGLGEPRVSVADQEAAAAFLDGCPALSGYAEIIGMDADVIRTNWRGAARR